MPKAIITVLSSFLFGSLGLLIAWLSYQAEFRTLATNRVVLASSVMNGYGFATITGGALGFGLAVASLKMFASPAKNEKSSVY